MTNLIIMTVRQPSFEKARLHSMMAGRACFSTAGILLLSACGGGGGPIASAPPPPASPVSTPAPTPAPLSGPAGLVSDKPFATTYVVSSMVAEGPSVDVDQTDRSQPLKFRYDKASDKYFITLPGLPEGSLTSKHSNHVASENNVATSSGPLPFAEVLLLNASYPPQGLQLTYTSLGSWTADTGRKTADGRSVVDHGKFAYGIPTAAGDVPVTGTARYNAVIEGSAGFTGPEGPMRQQIVGKARLEFDFANGGLSGNMEPYLSSNGFAAYEGSLGRFGFANTVHAVGSTSYSGAFLQPGSATPAGEFAGSFNGPRASELMAWFATPFSANMKLLYSGANFGRIDMLTGTLQGVWVGKKD